MTEKWDGHFEQRSCMHARASMAISLLSIKKMRGKGQLTAIGRGQRDVVTALLNGLVERRVLYCNWSALDQSTFERWFRAHSFPRTSATGEPNGFIDAAFHVSPERSVFSY
jgi:hypothetical protein